MLLKILHPDGRTWIHEANPGSTLAQLKLALAEECGVAPEGAHLIELWFSGYQLPAKKTLEECTELCDVTTLPQSFGVYALSVSSYVCLVSLRQMHRGGSGLLLCHWSTLIGFVLPGI